MEQQSDRNELIEKVSGGEEKRMTFSAMIKQHNLALKHGFYLEALLIDYAMVEDRLAAFLWACGAVKMANGKGGLGNKRNKDSLMQFYTAYTKNTNYPKMSNISAKIDVCQALLNFGESDYAGTDRYLNALHDGLKALDIPALRDTLNDVTKWKNYRNEVIHALMGKRIDSLYDDLAEKAECGLGYARVIDNASKRLKRRKNIRLSAKLSLQKF